MIEGIQPDYEASWDFMQRFHEDRLFVLTGVSLDKKSIPTESFGPKDKAQFIKWITACAKMPANVYFGVGEPKQKFSKKLEETDVQAMHFLHVDVDPVESRSVAQEQERILALLREPPGGLPPPTAIVFSGGGYQGFWKLDEPITTGGSQELADTNKLYNLQIAILLNADHVQNIDRIMRVPGTVNQPNAKKIKAGRVPALAELVEWHDDRVFNISEFSKAVMVQQSQTDGLTKGDGIGVAPKLKAPSNISRITHVDELGDKVSDSVKIYIVQGCNPDEPNHFESRSEMLFWVVCELVRAYIPDDTIYSVITDPTFRVSESVREKGSGMERYALRQIERATEDAVNPVLREFNDKHAVIENYGGKCVIIEEILDETLNRYRLSKQGFDHFRNRYMNRQIDMGPKTNSKGEETGREEMPAGQWWLKHRDRRQFTKIVFSPGKDVPNAYNLWRGFGCEAIPGDCSLFLDHVLNIVCGGVESYYNYFISWIANAVQNPGEQGHSAVALKGKQGSGKSIVPYLYGQLFGRHSIMVNNSKHLVGQFNAHLRDCVFLFADEAFFAGDKQNESVLKTIVTERMLMFELKGVDAEPAPNCVHLMMASNEKWVVPAAADDRRYFVLDVLPDKINDIAYFDAMVKQFEQDGGREALLHFLLQYDIESHGVTIRNVPKTEALQHQKAMSMDATSEWWMNILRRGTLLLEHDEWTGMVPIDLLAWDYMNYMRSFNISRRGNSTKIGMDIYELVPGIKRQQRTSPTEIPQASGGTKTVARPYFYVLPGLEDCRKHFDENYGGPHNWTDDLPPESLPDYGNDVFA